MKRTLMVGGIALAAFLLSTAGTYFALPYIAPDHVAEMRADDDTLTLADTLVDSDEYEPAVDTLDAEHANQLAEQERRLAVLEDSLTLLHDSLDQTTTEATDLAAEVDNLEDELATLEDNHAEAAEISQTLTQLEEREMRAVLDPLDLDVYEALYTISTGRNRTRLLQAMPPDEAAQLVARIVARDDDAPSSLPDDLPDDPIQ